MAQPLKYIPEAQTEVTAQEELDHLIETLHEHGMLRTLDGLFGKFPEVMEVLVAQLDTPGGRNALSNLAALSMGLTALNPDHVNDFRLSTERSLGAARESLKDEPPGLLALFRQLNDPEVRRGLNALLVFLHTLGKDLHQRVQANGQS